MKATHSEDLARIARERDRAWSRSLTDSELASVLGQIADEQSNDRSAILVDEGCRRLRERS
jgi:hypothetical protein